MNAPVVLINLFSVPPGKEEFAKMWAEALDFMCTG
jgi:hypothetical protein